MCLGSTGLTVLGQQGCASEDAMVDSKREVGGKPHTGPIWTPPLSSGALSTSFGCRCSAFPAQESTIEQSISSFEPYCHTNTTFHSLWKDEQILRAPHGRLPGRCRCSQSLRHHTVIPVAMQISLPIACLPPALPLLHTVALVLGIGFR